MLENLTGTLFYKIAATVGVSMLPILELRGGIPFGLALGLDNWTAFWASFVGNMLPIPFIILFLRQFLLWLEKKIPAARKLSNYAPACFLIFVLHYPLIMLIPSHIWKQSFFAPFVLIPAIIFLIVAFYLFLRKFFPACLPYVANDRITHVPKKN